MCGIVGVAGPDPTLRTEEIVRAMARRLAHRGPDDEGVVCVGDGTLGARRLAIIDLARGHQPMTDESGQIVAVQNGELYNFREIRAELASRGHRFATDNDTEILTHAYEVWGTDLFSRLRGMFALAIWDARERRLVLARDRFGKKPLVYAVVGESLLFASEIQALLAHPAIGRDLDTVAIAEYLVHGYVPPPRTAFAAIRKLPPGHTLDFHQGRITISRYWALRFAPKQEISLEDASTELVRLIDEAVRIRLISDVPLGAFLSGGLDSSTVVAFMARHTATRVQTFSIGFADADYDERRYARMVADAFDTDHHELEVGATDADVLPMLVRHLGEPFADSSIVPTYHVAALTRREVTVTLNGDGGDELFAGYDRYRAAALAAGVDAYVPRFFRSALAMTSRRVNVPHWAPGPFARAARFAAAADMAPERRFERWSGYFTGSLYRRVAGNAIRDIHPDPARILDVARAISDATHPAELYMASDILTALPGDLLVKMDIATMAASLEARSPLLDHKLAEFVASLPADMKLSGRTSKVLLRHAMRGILPSAILERQKMGFTAPVGRWLRGPLRAEFSERVLAGSAVSWGLIDGKTVAEIHQQHLSGRADRTTQLWALFVLQIWLDELVTGARGLTPAAVSS
jgi:asparagine synthase (glutamine-hydrolysing)